jgi:hypothetical protein
LSNAHLSSKILSIVNFINISVKIDIIRLIGRTKYLYSSCKNFFQQVASKPSRKLRAGVSIKNNLLEKVNTSLNAFPLGRGRDGANLDSTKPAANKQRFQ